MILEMDRATRRRRRGVAAAAAVTALGAIGCGSDTPSDASREAQTSAARTTENPPSSSELLAALRTAKSGSRERTLYSLYYYARWGNYPSLVRLYDLQVRSALGANKIAEVYSANRGRFLAVGVPRIVDTRVGVDGVTLNVELQPADGEVIQESYLMRERTGGWGIVYDTFFERAYGEAARLAVDGPGRKPSARGALAARRAASRFRSLALGD